MAQEGFIKLHRCILDSSWSRQPDFVAVWVYCLLRANYNAADVVTKGGMVVHLEPGQFITSREQISIGTGVQESKVERILKVFKSEQQIEQRNHGHFRVISILNWDKYQAREQQTEQHLNNRRTTDEQHLNTNKKEEEGKEREEGGATKKTTRTKRKLTDEEWLDSIKNNSAYAGINVDKLKAKMEAWCLTKGVQPTRQRLLNWLNREDAPLIKSAQDSKGKDDKYWEHQEKAAKLLRERGTVE